MKKYIARFNTPNNIELYIIKRGKLVFKNRIDSKACVKYKIEKILLAPSHYVSATMLAENINFSPEKGQFLFSDQSILQIEDLVCIPAIFDKNRKSWKQVWASKELLLGIQKFIPSAKYFYPQCLAVSEYELNTDNLSGLKFLSNSPTLPLAVVKRNTVFLVTLITCFSLIIAPWIPDLFFETSVVKTGYDNKLLLIQHFEKLALIMEISDLEKLTFNNSLDTINLISNEIFSGSQRNLAKNFCIENFCKIDFKDYELTVIFSKSFPNG